ADVHVRPGRPGGDRGEDLGEEGVGARQVGEQAAEADVGPGVGGRGLARRRELTARVERRVDVAGDVHLGDDGDPARRRVGHDPGQVLGRVPATTVAVDGGPPRDLGELGPGGDLDPPALVVGQVQVQDV